jgi:serine/threonine protein phosphatase PrpC
VDQTNDTVLLFSDGVDECIYEKPTIGIEHIANIVNTLHDPSLIFDALMTEVFEYGAEDNASLSIIKVRRHLGSTSYVSAAS